MPAQEGFEFTALLAGSRTALNGTELLGLRLGSRALFLAMSEESLGSMARIRVAATVDRAKAFTLNDALTVGNVRPSAPFHGTGTYRAAPDGSYAWSGPLSASFPGAPRTSLTGGQFEVKIASGF